MIDNKNYLEKKEERAGWRKEETKRMKEIMVWKILEFLMELEPLHIFFFISKRLEAIKRDQMRTLVLYGFFPLNN